MHTLSDVKTQTSAPAMQLLVHCTYCHSELLGSIPAQGEWIIPS